MFDWFLWSAFGLDESDFAVGQYKYGWFSIGLILNYSKIEFYYYI